MVTIIRDRTRTAKRGPLIKPGRQAEIRHRRGSDHGPDDRPVHRAFTRSRRPKIAAQLQAAGGAGLQAAFGFRGRHDCIFQRIVTVGLSGGALVAQQLAAAPAPGSARLRRRSIHRQLGVDRHGRLALHGTRKRLREHPAQRGGARRRCRTRRKTPPRATRARIRRGRYHAVPGTHLVAGRHHAQDRSDAGTRQDSCISRHARRSQLAGLLGRHVERCGRGPRWGARRPARPGPAGGTALPAGAGRAGRGGSSARGGSLKVDDASQEAHFGKNGVPYSENTVVTGFLSFESNGDEWFTAPQS